MKSTPALLLLLLLLLVDVRGSITALPPCVLPEAPQHSSPTAKEERFSFIPASSPSAWYTGRTKINSDGSRSFDWEGTQMWINITGASYVKVVINVTDNVVGMFYCVCVRACVRACIYCIARDVLREHTLFDVVWGIYVAFNAECAIYAVPACRCTCARICIYVRARACTHARTHARTHPKAGLPLRLTALRPALSSSAKIQVVSTSTL